MKYIEAPNVFSGDGISLFLAGGISNCYDWQKDLVSLLKDTEITLLNPRRANFVLTPENEEEQIKWEFEYLDKTDATSFWFPEETVCPVTLYELGKQTRANKPIFVGVHNNYSRKRDVIIQLNLVRPEIEVVHSLENLSEQIKKWAGSKR